MKYVCCAMVLFGVCGGTWSAIASDEEPGRWQVVKSADGWRLLRDGKPFYVQGAVGWNRFDVLKALRWKRGPRDGEPGHVGRGGSGKGWP